LFIEELDGDGFVRDPGDTEFRTTVVGDGGSNLQPWALVIEIGFVSEEPH